MMKLQIFAALVLILMSFNLQARDDRVKFPIAEVMERAKSEGMIDGSVKFLWGKKSNKKAKTTYGEITTNKKTNAFMKSDKEACDWAMLGAIKAFQQKAKSLGANAIVNIRSNYKHATFSSTEQYECGAGNVMAGVALKADFVKQ
ncbi:MAG: excinuclease ABC subunit A [Kangiellaceae bacterium]